MILVGNTREVEWGNHFPSASQLTAECSRRDSSNGGVARQLA